MSVGFFSPITKNTLIPLEENCSSLRFATHFFNFGQKGFKITLVDKKMCEVVEDTEKPEWMLVILRIIAMATVVIPLIMLLFLSIYQANNRFLVTDGRNKDDEKECAICLDFLSTDKTVQLKCNHIFHRECIEEWAKKSHVCPLMCKEPIQYVV